MDGVLIDSEPLWAKAEKAVFSSMGVKLTDENCLETRGLRISEAVAHWDRKFNIASNINMIKHLVGKNVRQLLRDEGKALSGVYQTINVLNRAGFRLAIASSSPLSIIKTVVKKLCLQDSFEFILSAENEIYGKPHPAVYIHCLKKLQLLPSECIVFEDSINGLISAKAAQLFTIAIQKNTFDPKFSIADRIIPSLTSFYFDMLNEE